MFDFFAVKHLAGSDLAWFRALYRVHANTNLKGINLNANPLTTRFYRDLQIVADAQNGRVPVTARILGPNAAGPYTGTFKIIRGDAYKNWRLNGTLVDDPIGEPHRFSSLMPDDIAVIAFTGRPAPNQIDLVLLSAKSSSDTALVTHFRRAFPKRGTSLSMFAIEPGDIAAALGVAGVPSGHPLGLLLADPEDAAVIEDAALGGSEGMIGRWRGKRRRITAADIAARRAAADRNGRKGEALLDAYLSRSGATYEWTAAPEHGDGFAPFDFELSDGPFAGLLDAKTTDGPFERPFHISLGEVIAAAERAEPYRIARIYQLGEDGALMKVSGDISALARQLRDAHDGAMFGGIRADAFTVPVDTAGLVWSEEIELAPVDAEDA